MQLCLTKMLGIEFNFKHMPDSQQLKSQTPYIIGKQSYFYLLISLIYSARNIVKLCRNGLNILYELVDLEIVRIDFLISRAGLLQMLINLLKFYSDSTANLTIKRDTEKEHSDVVNDLKNFLSLIGRLLLRLNENQDLELFDYYFNSLTYICFNSANNGRIHTF